MADYQKQIKFLQLSQTQYNSLANGTAVTVGNVTVSAINAYTIYFTTDTHRIFKGSVEFANAIRTTEATTVQSVSGNEKNALYVNATGGMLFYSDAEGNVSCVGQGVQGVASAIATAKAQAISSANSYTSSTASDIREQLAAASSTLSDYVNDSVEDALSSANSYTDASIEALDAGQVGGNGKVVTTISQTDGVISATAIDLIASNVGRSATSAISGVTVQSALQELAANIAASTDAQKSYTITALDATGIAALGDSNVKQAYQLVDEDNVVVGSTIKIYKDSSLKEVYIGSNTDTVASDGTVTKNSTSADNQYLNFVYQLSDGSYSLVSLDVSKFLTESQFDTQKGLAVTNGVVSVKLASDAQYLAFNANGQITDAGINAAISTAKAQAISSASSYTDSTASDLRDELATASSALSDAIGNSVNDLTDAIATAKAQAISSASSYTDSTASDLRDELATASSALSDYVDNSVEDALSSASDYTDSTAASAFSSASAYTDSAIQDVFAWIVLAD